MRADADGACARAYARRLGAPVDAGAVAALRRPHAAADAGALEAAADLLRRLEARFLARLADDDADGPRARAAAYVREDAAARLGELQVCALQRGGGCVDATNAVAALRALCARDEPARRGPGAPSK